MQKRNWPILFSLFLLACSKDNVVPKSGQDYYPLSPKISRIYDVTETTYVSKVQSVANYQLREAIYDSIISGQTTTYILGIERREDSEDTWRMMESVGVRVFSGRLEYQKDNRTTVLMSFPVKAGRSWDGNASNPDTEMLYSYEDLVTEIPFNEADHIKLVINDLPTNIVEEDQRYEIYGRGIGLVERSYNQIRYCQQGCSGLNQPQDGTILTQRLVQYNEF